MALRVPFLHSPNSQTYPCAVVICLLPWMFNSNSSFFPVMPHTAVRHDTVHLSLYLCLAQEFIVVTKICNDWHFLLYSLKSATCSSELSWFRFVTKPSYFHALSNIDFVKVSSQWWALSMCVQSCATPTFRSYCPPVFFFPFQYADFTSPIKWNSMWNSMPSKISTLSLLSTHTVVISSLSS